MHLFHSKKGKAKLQEPEIKKVSKQDYLWTDGEARDSIAFFSTYRSPIPLDIFSCPIPPTSSQDELSMTDGTSYNYNGRITGMIFVSERDSLELLHIALSRNDVKPPSVSVYSLAEVFRRFYSRSDGVQMEDSGCFTNDHLIFVSTKEKPTERRQPWTAVYKTNLITGKTDRLTPRDQADLNPSVSPSGKKIVMASFEGTQGWDGAVEDLKTNIYVMNVEEKYDRRLVVKNGRWPTWGSEDIIFFHRKDDKRLPEDSTEMNYWGVYRVDISRAGEMHVRVTPDNIDAFTPAAIDSTTIAVATTRQKSEFGDTRVDAQYRHIEIFYSTGGREPTQITPKNRSKDDHFNPFVIGDGKRIGYHRCASVVDDKEKIKRRFQIVTSPNPDVGLFRVGGFPTFSKNGSRLAFVDSDSKIVWVLDKEHLYEAFELTRNSIFSPVWNQNDRKDTLYVCVGPSFIPDDTVDICAVRNVSRGRRKMQQLTDGGFNNAFPSSSPDGYEIVVLPMCTDGSKIANRSKNSLPIYKKRGEFGVPEKDDGLDPRSFAVYLVNPEASDAVRVIESGDGFMGFVNHPFFSPDGLSIVVTSDFAAVSVDPISDIFTVDIDPDDIQKNKDLKTYNRITHSRYENCTGAWTGTSTGDTSAARRLLQQDDFAKEVPCPYLDGGES
ncbi:hypothetical protein C5167_035538 [Papaver somniferum]|uniref:Dipeptidylpeptidase IV N-terminal domain-containing protein n=1 Tax=Papaver somniferum TaxID=3469 RepID=A0A4Y7KHK4_PAPSO|nr:hypothetical protein C5167_035538 [Papaver somniferum]